MKRLTLHIVDVTSDDNEVPVQTVTGAVVSDALAAAMLRAAADDLDPPKPAHRVTRGGSEVDRG